MANLKLTPTQNQNQAGYSGYGSLLTVSEDKGVSTEFPGTLMGALMGINAINIRTNVIPSYHMRSLGRFQSFSPGLRDGGEVSAAVNWLPGMNDTQGRGTGTWSLLRQATLESNALTRLRIFAPDPDLHMVTTEGFLTQLGPLSYQPEAIMSGQVGWKIVGSPDIVTPIVFRIDNYTPPATEAAHTFNYHRTSATDLSNGFTVAGVNQRMSLITGGSTSDTGSAAAGILVGSGYQNAGGLFTDNSNRLIITLDNQSATKGIRVHFEGTRDDISDSSDLRVRAYVPGEFEAWSADLGATLGTEASLTDSSGMIDRITALAGGGVAPSIYIAVYGGAEL